MAKICHENGLTKGPDIVSFIRLSMECLSQYIIFQRQKGGSAAIEQQKKKEGEADENREAGHQTVITIPRGVASTAIDAYGAEKREGLSYLEQYFHPVFDELNKLNSALDSLIEAEENNKRTERKKK